MAGQTFSEKQYNPIQSSILHGTESRTYERTHPWINFSADLRRLSHLTWIKLGECQSKCVHISKVPLVPGVVENLHLIYLVKGARATTAIEGNTLSEEEVERLVAGTLNLPPSREYLKVEVDNAIKACNLICDQAAKGEIEISRETIKLFNFLILKGLQVEPEVRPGEVRTHSVGVARYRGAPPEDCEFLLRRLCDWLREMGNDLVDGMPIASAIIRAILAHLYIAWIHPFADGNGRTARLLEFAILMASGVPSPAAHLLSNHYNATRQQYYRQLDKSSRSESGVADFIEYAIQGLLDGLGAQLEHIHKLQFRLTWEKFVRDAFETERPSPANDRRQAFAITLGSTEEWTPISLVIELDPTLTRSYAAVSPKTLTRDMNMLQKMGILSHAGLLVRPRVERIHAMLPVTATPAPESGKLEY